MRSRILLISLFCCIVVSSHGQQYGWIDLSTNIPDHDSTFNTLRDVQFIGQKGWIAASLKDIQARIYHTTDGGLSFKVQEFPQNSGAYCTSLFMRDTLTGYATTNTGNILCTSDGGLNWSIIGSGMGLLHSLSFPPLPEPFGYACSANGSVYRITGKDIVLDLHLSAYFYSITCPVNSNEAWVCGGPAIRHRNSSGWQIGDQNYSTGYAYNSICFTDNFHGWAVGANGIIIYTSNGTDWLGVQGLPDNNLNDVYFINTNEGWTVGNEIILHSVDGGITWNQEATSLLDSTLLTSVFAPGNHEVYAVGTRANKACFLKYSEIIGLNEQPDTESWLYPNPAKNKCKLQLAGYKRKQSVVELCELSGKKVRLVFTGFIPDMGIDVDLEGLPSGLYYLRVYMGGQVISHKIVKQ